jgi:hypothetical protein
MGVLEDFRKLLADIPLWKELGLRRRRLGEHHAELARPDEQSHAILDRLEILEVTSAAL